MKWRKKAAEPSEWTINEILSPLRYESGKAER
jgi:hypothetical protein